MAASARTPGEAAWPEQMITQAEAFALAHDWPVRPRFAFQADDPAKCLIDLECGKCGRSTGQLLRDGVLYNGTLDEMLSMVLRHMVMAHDVSLAGLRATPGCACCGTVPARPGELTCQGCAGYEDRALDHRHEEVSGGT